MDPWHHMSEPIPQADPQRAVTWRWGTSHTGNVYTYPAHRAEAHRQVALLGTWDWRWRWTDEET